MRILISAGEASGEMYGAQLIAALRRRHAGAATGSSTSLTQSSAVSPTNADIEFFGVGGERMRAAGCETVVDAKDLAVVGITEILSQLPKIYRLFDHLIAEADKRKPDLAVVIDSPAFNWRVARHMHKRGIPVVYYVCPQFWAWRQGRVKLLRKYIKKALVIFPFEEKFYCERGVDASFVGHPLADLPAPAIERADYARKYKLDPEKHWITLMPGSRVKEVRMNLPTILEAASQFGQTYEFLLPVAPTLDHLFVDNLVRNHKWASTSSPRADSREPQAVVPDAQSLAPSACHLVPEALPALWHSRAGIVASGTATVEAAMMSTPLVMVYRVSPLTYALGRWRIKVPHFAMVNLIAEEEVVPELVQQDFTAPKVIGRLMEILPDGAPREKMLEGLARVKARLRRVDQDRRAPAERAADAILGLVQEHNRA